MYKVLKPFPYAHDGLKIEELKEGDTREFRPELVEGLKDDGYIGDVEPAPQPANVEPVKEAPAAEAEEHGDAAAEEAPAAEAE